MITAKYDFHDINNREKEKYDIHLSDFEISSIIKSKIKTIVNESGNKFAFSWLVQKAKTQSKCDRI